jgi:hypothetical protein
LKGHVFRRLRGPVLFLAAILSCEPELRYKEATKEQQSNRQALKSFLTLSV